MAGTLPSPGPLSAVQQAVKAAYGNRCIASGTGEAIADTNGTYFHPYGLTRQSFLDVFIAQLIIMGFSANFATELATGMYGLESVYGANTGCTGKYCGPLQIDAAFYDQWYVKQAQVQAHPNEYLNPYIQIQAVAFANWTNYNTLLRAYPNGTWRSGTIEPFDVYMMHQQGQNLGTRAGYQAYINNGPNFAPVSKMSGYSQAGIGTLYNASSTIRQFLAAEEALFLQSAARGGTGNCGEFAVRFYAGNT